MHLAPWLRLTLKGSILPLIALLGCGARDNAMTGAQPLTIEQCTFFAKTDKVTICHRTSSPRKPYVTINTNMASCGGHDRHEGDYVAYNDPTCSGQGCYPEGAPFDSTVECCEGLASVGGYCTVVACHAHASGAPPGASPGRWSGASPPLRGPGSAPTSTTARRIPA